MQGYFHIAILVFGICLQIYTNETSHVVLVVGFWYAVGSVLATAMSRGARLERLTFSGVFAICVLVSGLLQVYSLSYFLNIQSTKDAVDSFYPFIAAAPPFATMADAPFLQDSTLAVVIWQQSYKVGYYIGLVHGPYIGIVFNSFIVALMGALTVNCGRIVMGDNEQRLRRISRFVYSNGLFILFGAVLIRDAFTCFATTLVIWALLRWIAHPGGKSALVVVASTAVALVLMFFLRFEAVVIIVGAVILGLSSFVLAKTRHLGAIIAIAFVVLIAVSDGLNLGQWLGEMTMMREERMLGYNELSEENSGGESLGLAYVINQSAMVRLVTGSVSMLVSPIPLWRNFLPGVSDYHLMKGYHGVYQIVLVPFFIVGLLALVSRRAKISRSLVSVHFLVIFGLAGLVTVVMTSLEGRHLAQFNSAWILVAAIPIVDLREEKKLFQKVAASWAMLVVVVHMAWIFLRG